MHTRRRGATLVTLMLITGCASQYSHYGSLTSENAAGQTRDFAVSWRSAESLSWLGGTHATAVTLESQCSERVLVFREAGDPARTCGGPDTGIVLCGSEGQDLLRSGSRKATATDVCGEIRGLEGVVQDIGGLSTRIQVYIHCWPAQTEIQRGEDKVNQDYLRASPVPYQFSVKKVVRGSSDDRKPVFDTKVCKEP